MIRAVAAGGLSIALCLVAVPALITAPAFAGTTRASATVSTTGAPGAAEGSSGLPDPTGKCAPPAPGSDPQSDPNLLKAATGTPWAQTMLSYPSVWRLTEGGGETVALIDSGVDANPQLNGRVVVGPTLATAPSGPANGDCVGHGTLAAGLIAASSKNGGMGGMAPQATIYSEKVTNSESVNVDTLATAINDAVAAHVQVISMSIDSTQGDGNLAAAVQNALSNNIVVVAAAGNDTLNNKGQVTKAGPFYPASYPGVLSVGAVDDTGALADFSDQKSQVGVTAPGVDVTSTYPGANGDSYAADAGTSFATPLVAGLAALVRARYPQLSAAQVVQRIEETADGNEGPGTGYGLINPVQALTAVIPAASKSQPASVTINRPATNGTQKEITLALAGGAVAIVAIVLAAAVVIPAGRRRRWRPGDLS